MNFTIIGASGFIGRAMTLWLCEQGHSVFTPGRGDEMLFTRPLGHLIYAAGVTADFRSRPFDTLRAHTTLVADILERASFDSLLYLSSARIYRHSEHTAEDAPVLLRSSDPEDLYDLTKMTAESMCATSRRDNARIARLTNVVGSDFGSDNFLYSLIREACDRGTISLRTALASEKDYVMIKDVVRLLTEITISGREMCYNVAAGRNLRHSDLTDAIASATGAAVTVSPEAVLISMPVVSIRRVREEFGFLPSDVLPHISELIGEYRSHRYVKG